MRPSVSVLVPICNVQRYLRECILSLVNQTLDNIEIILINDGSTDTSPDIVYEFARRDSRIKVIDKPNSGYGDSMNRGLDLATGEYVGIVESDDFAASDMFERLYGIAKKQNADVVRSNFYAYSTTGDDGPHEEFVENLQGCPYGRVIDPFEHQQVFLCRPAIWTGLYRRSFLLERGVRFLPTPGASFQDTGFCFKAIYSAERFVLTKDAFLRYRVDNDGSSVKSQAKVFPICEEYAEIWRFAQGDPDKFEKIKRRIPYQQFGGYRWNLERLVPQIRHQFYERMVGEFRDIEAAGLLDEAFFDPVAWGQLTGMLADPDGYYLRTYGPVDVEATVVACLAGLGRDAALSAVRELLSSTGDSDEIILVHEDSADLIDILRSTDSRSGRVYCDDDLIVSDLLLAIDPGRVRGSRLVVACASQGASGSVELPGRGTGASFIDGWGLVYGEASGLLASNAGESLSLPLLVLDALLDSDCLEFPNGLGMCARPVGKITGSEFVEASERVVGFAGILAGAGLSYERARALYELALPLWCRVRHSIGVLADESAEMARDAYMSMADAPAFEMPNGTSRKGAGSLVSVIVPVYNVREYLGEAVDSILSQDLSDIEILLINDGSTDGSLGMIEDLARKDARVRVISQFNCGAGAARNRGIALARGHILAFIDPDDLYPSPHALSSLVEGLQRSGALMCGGSFSLLKPTGEIQEKFPFGESFYRSDVERDVSPVHVWNDYGWIRFVYDARLFADGSLRFPQLGWYEDPVFFARAAAAAGGYHLIPDVVYRYRVNYKKIDWTPARVRDLLDGISLNLEFAVEHNMAELYTTLVDRIDREYCLAIVKTIEDEGVMRRLLSIQESLRADLYLPARDKGEDWHLLSPLDLLATGGNRRRDTAVVRLARKVESSSIYRGIQSVIRRMYGRAPEQFD